MMRGASVEDNAGQHRGEVVAIQGLDDYGHHQDLILDLFQSDW
jgi:hypothetical protein